jgi:glycosyltransferase involved in cell wall biosynthesis
MNLLVSIIIPYYNRPEKLQRAIDSIVAQTHSNFEIIIIDDHSKEHLCFEKENIYYIRNIKNVGPGASRNIGLEKAKGNYVVFMDSDDYWDKNFLKTCLIAFERSASETVMVYSNTLGFNENNIYGNKGYQVIRDTKILPTILQRGRPWETSACMWDSKKIKDVLWIEARSWEDYAFDVAVAIKFNDIVPINKNLVYYDEYGDDKLSLQEESKTSIEKSKSINYISNTLKKSEYFKSHIIKMKIVIMLLNSIIALIRTGNQNKEYVNENIESLKTWKNTSFIGLIQLVCLSPTRIRLPLLRRIRNKMQRKHG